MKNKCAANSPGARTKPKSSGSGKSRLFPIFLLCLLVLAAYANSLFNDFVWDDKLLIVQDRFVRESGHVAEIFSTNAFAGSGRQSQFFRPLQILTYAFDCRVWGLNPAGYHLTGILLHLAVSLLVYFVIVSLFADTLIAFFAAAVFAVHPANSEAVTYIAGRADILFLLFLLLSLRAYLNGERARTPSAGLGLYAASLFFFVCALLSKEMAIIFPLLLVFTFLLFRGDLPRLPAAGRWTRIAGFFVILAAYAALRLTKLRFPAEIPEFQTTCRGIGPMLITYLEYLKIYFFPVRLQMERLTLPGPFPPLSDLLAVLALAAAVVYLIRNGRSRIAWFGLGWFFISLLPVSNIVSLNSALAEHWLYLPSLGLLVIFGAVFSRLRKGPGAVLRPAVGAVFVLLLALLSIRTMLRNRDWRNGLTLFQQTAASSPRSARAHNGLGAAYARLGRMDDAIREFKLAIELFPDHEDAHANLGAAYGKIGRIEEAIGELKKGLTLNPNNADAHNNLGAAYGKTGRYDESIEELKIALRLDPHRKGIYKNLGLTFRAAGRKKEAVENLEHYLASGEVPDDEARAIREMIARMSAD